LPAHGLETVDDTGAMAVTECHTSASCSCLITAAAACDLHALSIKLSSNCSHACMHTAILAHPLLHIAINIYTCIYICIYMHMAADPRLSRVPGRGRAVGVQQHRRGACACACVRARARPRLAAQARLCTPARIFSRHVWYSVLFLRQL
jgi:hypothetical protein